MGNYLRALRYFRHETGSILLAFLLSLLSAAAALGRPWPMALIVDSVLGEQPFPVWLAPWFAGMNLPVLLALLCLAILVFHALHGALSAWHNYLTIEVSLRGLSRVRNELFRCLQRLSLRFHQGSNQGDIIYRASWDTYAFQTLFQQGLVAFVNSSLALMLMLAIMWQLNRNLTLVAFATIPLLLLAMKLFGGEMTRRSLEAHRCDSKVTSGIQQNIQALPLIQSYTREQHEQNRFATEVATSFQKRLSQHGWEVCYLLVIAVIFGLGTAAIAGFGANEVLQGRLTVGELLVFLAYLAQLYEPLNQLSHVGATVADARAGTQRVLELLDTTEEIRSPPGARRVQRAPVSGEADAGGAPQQNRIASNAPLITRGNITFERVSFEYLPERPVLHDINLSIRAGESVALIGPSGSGKSTLLQLIPRFFDPTSGQVQLEGVDLRELRLKDLRDQVALVLQEPILMPASVAENIAYGRPDATMDEIRAAAEAAHALDFILKLASQFDTPVGEGGARLSVGEKQRINIARAFLKDAPVLVLDEPTSALDPESEQLVVASITRLMRRRTTILAAHRITTVRQVQRIIVLEKGRVSESGSFEQLSLEEGYLGRALKM
jgi:ATP-binding cassette, subfamily B, bacterial